MQNYRINDLRGLSERFRALGNPARLGLFLRLASCCRGPAGDACCDPAEARRCVGDLAEGLDLAPSTVSHHLKELRRAGLIRCERRGQRIDCWVEPPVLAELVRWFDLPPGREGDTT